MARKDYTLAVFDANGQEQRDQNGDFGSQKAAARLQNEGSTDVFIMSHGWMGDTPSAIWQYDHWTDALMACPDDIAALGKLRPGFKPLMIGYHWPSLPWGNEAQVDSFALDPTAPAFDPVADAAQKLGGTPEIFEAVKRVFAEVAAAPDPNVMPPSLKQAYLDLDKAVNPPPKGAGAEPGADRLPFDPEQVFQAARDASDPMASFGGFSLGDLLSPLRTASFWSMKDRARKLGETAGTGLLTALQKEAGARDVRFHLMGHSFGCIVVSAIMAGKPGGVAPKPVHSAVLAQGALSLWSYTGSLPNAAGKPGYFNPILKNKQVSGPIVTTQSQFDKAVGKWYPIAAGLAKEVTFGVIEFPLYGGVGTFGLQGVDHMTPLASMLGVGQQYGFKAGNIYNIQSDNVIKTLLDNTGGAHSDINHPEVGHVVWQAAMTEV